MTELSFDAASHTYHLDGRILPHVTGIVAGVLPVFGASEWHMNRGTATHYACELLDRGVLDWETVDPEILPRVQAWAKFRTDYPAIIVGNETKLVHPTLRYAGRIDRMFEVDGKLILADLKNSVSPQVRVQLGLYSLAWTANFKRKVSKAVAVELLGTGLYKCLWIDTEELRAAENTALAALTVYNFKQKWGLK